MFASHNAYFKKIVLLGQQVQISMSQISIACAIATYHFYMFQTPISCLRKFGFWAWFHNPKFKYCSFLGIHVLDYVSILKTITSKYNFKLQFQILVLRHVGFKN